MTPYESADLSQSFLGNSLSCYAIFLSIVTAYLVTTFFVGAKLTKSQVTMLTGLFLLVASVSLFGITAFLDAGTRHSLIAFPDSTENLLGAKRWLTPVVGLVNAFVIVVSLKFMWDVRHLKNSD